MQRARNPILPFHLNVSPISTAEYAMSLVLNLGQGTTSILSRWMLVLHRSQTTIRMLSGIILMSREILKKRRELT